MPESQVAEMSKVSKLVALVKKWLANVPESSVSLASRDRNCIGCIRAGTVPDVKVPDKMRSERYGQEFTTSRFQLKSVFCADSNFSVLQSRNSGDEVPLNRLLLKWSVSSKVQLARLRESVPLSSLDAAIKPWMLVMREKALGTVPERR